MAQTASTMRMTVNNWTVEWQETRSRRSAKCTLLVNCRGDRTRGTAVFTEKGKRVPIAGVEWPVCCQLCAVGYVTREGLKGCITVERVIEELSR